MTRNVGLLLVVALALAGAIYLRPASIEIVAWSSRGPARIALLPPLARLWWSLAGVGVVVAAGAFIAERRGRLETFAASVSPLALVGLWVVPFLPWLPDRAPALLALAGPLRWILLSVAIGGAAFTGAHALGRGTSIRWLPGRYLVFVISLSLYLVFGLANAGAVGPEADEPHYLIIAQSLLVDHDLDIENNHAQSDYRAFYDGELRPDFMVRGVHGTIYSIHAPGLPALLLPAYAIAGYRGAVVFMTVLAALAALAVFDLASMLAGARAGTFTWAAVCLTVPFMPHAWLIFPEMAGALVVAWAVGWLWELPSASPGRWFLRGIALAWLPWLHTKFIVLLAVLTVFLAIRLWPRVRPIAALAVPIAVSGALWLYSFYAMYGVVDPTAPYGDYARLYVTAWNIPRGLIGLLVDQKFGLLVYSPVYLAAIAGGWLMLGRREWRAFGLALGIAIAAFVLSTARMYMWWGGSSAPARFLVPVVPLAAPMIAVAYRELRGATNRALLGAFALVSVACAVAASAMPDRLLLFSDAHGASKLLLTLQGSAPLSAILPTFTDEDWPRPLLKLAPWLVAAILGWLAARMAGARLRSARAFWTAVAGGATLFIAGSVLAGRYPPSVRAAAVTDGQSALMNAYDPGHLRAVDYRTLKRLGDAEVVDASALGFRREFSGLGDDPRRLAGPVSLPAGQYRVQVWFDGGSARDSDVVVTSGRATELVRLLGPLSNPATIAVTLPVSVPRLSVAVTQPSDAAAVRRIEIIPTAIVPLSARPDVDVHAVEPIGGHGGGAYLVYADANSYPEGGTYWTRDTRRGLVYVAPGGAATILLTLHVGPAGGDITLRTGDRDLVLPMAHDETRQFAIPVPAGATLVPIAVQASRAFRPVDVDQTSRDWRRLGCQVRVELER